MGLQSKMSDWVMGDTPWTVTTTRAPAVLKMSENGEIYTAGKNFTVPPAVKNLTSAHHNDYDSPIHPSLPAL